MKVISNSVDDEDNEDNANNADNADSSSSTAVTHSANGAFSYLHHHRQPSCNYSSLKNS